MQKNEAETAEQVFARSLGLKAPNKGK